MNSLRYYIIAGISLLAVSIASSIGISEPQNTPYQFPTTNTPGADYRIDYEDWNEVLSDIVVNVGRSEHIHAPKQRAITGSNIKLGNSKSSRLEGNRVDFHRMEQRHIDFVRGVKERLESVPEQVSLNAMSKDTQLAYWLNLHNVTVFLKLSELYPITDLEPLYTGEENCVVFEGCEVIEPILKNASVTIEGKTTTLENIRNYITTHWKDPLVIYGFYMGHIGGPNIRQSAYRGTNVWQQLENNAEEFINSIRGTQIWGNRMRISEHYRYAKRMFGNFDTNIRIHLNKYANRKLENWLLRNPSIDISVDNWGIADLYNGRPHAPPIPGSGNDTPAILVEFIGRLQRKFDRQARDRTPNVEIEELDPGKSQAPKGKSDDSEAN